MGFLGMPLGYAIYYIYKLIPNYAISIIIFTVILRILLIPMAIKQQKQLARTSAFQPYINEINKKYAKNFAKKNEELQKLYKSYNINPAAGCLPMFLPLVILLGMMDVVYRPLTHILHLPPDVINSAVEIFKKTTSFMEASGGRNGSVIQIKLIGDVIDNPSNYQSLGQDVVDSISSIDLNFFGFNVGDFASLVSPTVIFPILAFVFSLAQAIITLKTKSMPTNASGPSFKIVMFAMSIFSIFVSLRVPIGVSIYWITGYVIQVIQILILNKICNVEELKEKIIVEIEAAKKKNKKVEVKKEDGTTVLQKDNDRINNARKILGKKYDD